MRFWPALLTGLALGLLVSVPRSNPSAAEEALEFHGTGSLARRLSPGQRRPMPSEVVELGKAREVVYEAPAGSRRAGLWRHKFGSKPPTLVADPQSEKIALIGGAARLDPRAGIRN